MSLNGLKWLQDKPNIYYVDTYVCVCARERVCVCVRVFHHEPHAPHAPHACLRAEKKKKITWRTTTQRCN